LGPAALALNEQTYTIETIFNQLLDADTESLNFDGNYSRTYSVSSLFHKDDTDVVAVFSNNYTDIVSVSYYVQIQKSGSNLQV
jgi:hypothetical protein